MYEPTGHPVLDEMLALVNTTAEPDTDSNDDEISALQSALSVALELIAAAKTPAEAAYDTARIAYQAAASSLSNACHRLLVEKAKLRWPDADTLVLEGAYPEDGELHLHIDELHIGEDRLSIEDGNEDLDAFDDAVNELLMYLVETTGEDYLGTTEVDLQESA